MTTTPLDLPTLIAAMPHVAKLAHAEKVKPDVRQQLFGPLIQEQIDKNQDKVQQVNKKEKTEPVDRDGKQQHQQAQPKSKQRKKEVDDDPETGYSDPSPWSGNIVNVKI
ncbi:hypothetical protein [Pseudodesulfovibrio sp. zrk46]|uniref:hypothetical protein n=1 Tax=Pseudodesulfovibrio sp. zrk46 TaxID=2725288 RepID=UPI001449F1E1|nr:hypothetical protein [Pseudodesulfovibrio sp. zrk46]QJB57953.1 hypothetical protein HFN16_16850 [Pseudodesulfovibrio sp. zrk46]